MRRRGFGARELSASASCPVPAGVFCGHAAVTALWADGERPVAHIHCSDCDSEEACGSDALPRRPALVRLAVRCTARSSPVDRRPPQRALRRLLRCSAAGEITKLAIERKLLKCMGKTPENTMASALYTEVRKKAGTTVFIK